MEIVRSIGHFTAQANANAIAANPNAVADGETFDDADMFRAQGITPGHFYIGDEDASIESVRFGEAYFGGVHIAAAESGECEDSYTNDDERYSADIYRITLADTGEPIYAVVSADDADTVVRFFDCPSQADAAFRDACGEDDFGGRC